MPQKSAFNAAEGGCGPQTRFYGDKAMSKEEILAAIQGLAEKLGSVPTLTEIKTMTPVGRRAVRSHFGSYTNALIQCGMETGRRADNHVASLHIMSVFHKIKALKFKLNS